MKYKQSECNVFTDPNRIYISIRFEASQIKIERRPLGSSFNLDLHKVPFLQAGPMISTELNKPGPSWLFNSSIPQTFRSISAHPELRDRTGHLTPVQSLTAGPIGLSNPARQNRPFNSCSVINTRTYRASSIW